MNKLLLLLSLTILNCKAMEESEPGKTLIVAICKRSFEAQTFEGMHMAQRSDVYQNYDLQDLFRREILEKTEIGKQIQTHFPEVMQTLVSGDIEINKSPIPSSLFTLLNNVIEKYIKISDKEFVYIDSFPSDEENDEHLRKLQELEDARTADAIIVNRPRISMGGLQLDLEDREWRMQLNRTITP